MIQPWGTSLMAVFSTILSSGVNVLTMTDAHPPLETLNTLGVEHIPDHTVGLDLVETTARATRDDACCILTTVLQHGQPLDAIAREKPVSVRRGKHLIRKKDTYISVAAADVWVAKGS